MELFNGINFCYDETHIYVCIDKKFLVKFFGILISIGAFVIVCVKSL